MLEHMNQKLKLIFLSRSDHIGLVGHHRSDKRPILELQKGFVRRYYYFQIRSPDTGCNDNNNHLNTIIFKLNLLL